MTARPVAVRVTIRIDYDDGTSADIQAEPVRPPAVTLTEPPPPDIVAVPELIRQPPPRVLTFEVTSHLFTFRPNVAAAEETPA